MPDSGWEAAMGRIPSGLFILTLQQMERATGLLVSWVQQCAFVPPLLTIGLRKGRYHSLWLKASAAATLHILGEEHKALVRHFAQGFAEEVDAFAGLAVERRAPLAPLLRDTLAALDLRFLQSHAVGDHELMVLEVIGGQPLQEGKPYVHLRKSGLNY